MLVAGLDDLLEKIGERDSAAPDSYPAASIRDLHECGFIRAPLPAELGGQGCSLVDSVRGIEALARHSGSAALITSMPLGLAGIVAAADAVVPEEHRRRWSEQRERLAADYVAGKLYAACNSEKGAGGSLEATQTVARKVDGGFELTGEKILASGGANADWFFSTAKVSPDDLPGAGVVEFFLVPTKGEGVEIAQDWDGFGMRATESQTVRYRGAVASDYLGFPDFINAVGPLQYWFCLFAAIPLGCAGAMLQAIGTSPPESPALRLRLSEALMRYEALTAYLLETAAQWRPAAGRVYAARVLRTKSYVTQEATKLAAELFALSGGRHYRRTGAVARAFADSFAGTALRPPLPLGLAAMVENFTLGELE